MSLTITLGKHMRTYAPTLILAGMITVALCPDALAMKEDTMKEGLTTLEGFLTGNMMRLMVLGGGAYGAFHAFMKQQPALLAGSVGTGLDVNFLLGWVKSTWDLLVYVGVYRTCLCCGGISDPAPFQAALWP